MKLTRALVGIVLLGLGLPAFADSPEPNGVVPVPTLTVDKNTMTDEVILTWTATTGSYSVARNTDPNFFGGVIPTVIASGVVGTTFDDSVLTDGIDYFYTIEDANAATQIYGSTSLAGLPGDSITLTGIGFASVLGDNEVFIANELAVVTGVTDSTLTFTVPTDLISGFLVAATPNGVASGGLFGGVVTEGLMNISSLGVDTTGVPFVADTGSGGTADKVFTFDPSTGSRLEVGALNEATGLPSDTSNRVYYGNALVNAASSGRIERTTADPSDMEFFRNCGNAGGGDPCHVWGIGLDPDLTDFGLQGRVYVADGANNKVRIVPDGGSVQDFATGFSFGNSPRGIVVDRNSGSSFYHDVFVADATAVRRYDSSTVPGVLQETYNTSNSPIVSPRQMAITPLPRERLLIADDGRDAIVMINPDTDASKLVDFPLSNPRGIALDEDAGGVTFAYVAEQTRVLKVPIHETLVVSIWVANGALLDDRLVRDLVERVGIGLEPCGIEVQIRDDAINNFDPGVLLELETTDWSTESCADPLLERTAEEAALLDAPSRRSSVAEDLNIYFVKSFETAGMAETATEDCFSDVSDDTGSGIIISAEKLAEFGIDAVPTLAHEVGHALIDRTAWTNSTGNEHFDLSDTEYTAPNIMSTAKTIGTGRDRRTLDDSDQCLNINTNTIIFRGDP